MKKQPPAFQFYPADYLAEENVAMMTLEEEGAYIRALAYCWREGTIPAGDKKLAVLLKGASTDVLRVVKACFHPSPSDSLRLVHSRLDAEREKQTRFREKCSKGGKASAEARKTKEIGRKQPCKGGSTVVQPGEQGGRHSSSVFISPKRTPPASSISKEASLTSLVMDKLGLAGKDLQAIIKGVVKSELKAGLAPDAIVSRLSTAWAEYEQAKPRLNFASGAQKFFGEGIWRNRDGWSWKDGMAPAVERVYANA